MENYFDLIPGEIKHSMITLEWGNEEFKAKETGPYDFIFRLEKIENKFRAYYVHEGFEGVDYILPMPKEVQEEALLENTIPFWIIDDIKTFNSPEEATRNLYEWLEKEEGKL